MLDVFGYLRRKAHDAVLGGIADAVQKVAPGESAPTDLDGLRAMLAMTDVKAIAGPSGEPVESETTATKRKAK